MATYQEIFTAYDIAVHASRLHEHKFSLETTMQGIGTDGLPLKIYESVLKEDDHLVRDMTFDEIKVHNNNRVLMLKTKCNRATTYLDALPLLHIQNGLDDLKFQKSSIRGNFSDLNQLATTINVDLATKQDDLDTVATTIQAQTLPFDEIDITGTISESVRYAAIVHDLVDTMGYELQGRNPGNGDADYLTKAKDRVARTFQRIKAARHYLQFTDDGSALSDIVDYVDSTYVGKNNIQLAAIGQYIDAALPKLKILRRDWA